jgi:phage gp36-like protein
MPYSTDTDLLKEISLSDLSKLTGEQNNENYNVERVVYARSNADALINSYLCGRYSSEFLNSITLIKKISIDLTLSNLYEYQYSKTIIPDTITIRKADALQMLQSIQKGELSLINEQNEAIQTETIISNRTDKFKKFKDILLNRFF